MGTDPQTRRRLEEFGSPARTEAQICNSNPAVLEYGMAYSLTELQKEQIWLPGILNYPVKTTVLPQFETEPPR